jgi:hypothetical protein
MTVIIIIFISRIKRANIQLQKARTPITMTAYMAPAPQPRSTVLALADPIFIAFSVTAKTTFSIHPLHPHQRPVSNWPSSTSVAETEAAP